MESRWILYPRCPGYRAAIRMHDDNGPAHGGGRYAQPQPTFASHRVQAHATDPGYGWVTTGSNLRVVGGRRRCLEPTISREEFQRCGARNRANRLDNAINEETT